MNITTPMFTESTSVTRAGFAIGVRIVEVIATGSVSGIIIARCRFFVVNRILPLDLDGRAGAEVWTFYAVWIATFAHASLRLGREGWRERNLAIASLAVLAVVLNTITTGDHLRRSLTRRHLWPVAGMDLMLLAGAIIAVLGARKLADPSMQLNVKTLVEEGARRA
ncbi:MAG: hypothetical protein JZU55_17165 [Afipia sp.]|nr:hypothetical protein [Afipia sp.]